MFKFGDRSKAFNHKGGGRGAAQHITLFIKLLGIAFHPRISKHPSTIQLQETQSPSNKLKLGINFGKTSKMPPKRRGIDGDAGALVEVKKRKMEGALVTSTGKPAMQVNSQSMH
jgi:hypothetical protein